MPNPDFLFKTNPDEWKTKLGQNKIPGEQGFDARGDPILEGANETGDVCSVLGCNEYDLQNSALAKVGCEVDDSCEPSKFVVGNTKGDIKAPLQNRNYLVKNVCNYKNDPSMLYASPTRLFPATSGFMATENNPEVGTKDCLPQGTFALENVNSVQKSSIWGPNLVIARQNAF